MEAKEQRPISQVPCCLFHSQYLSNIEKGRQQNRLHGIQCKAGTKFNLRNKKWKAGKI